MKPPKMRALPPPCESRTPLCSLCGAETVFDGFEKLICAPCGAWWSTRDYWREGNWAEEDAPVCASRIRPWKGSTDYPVLSDVVERCLLTAGHDPKTHRSANHDWTNDDVDGYRAVRPSGRPVETVPLPS